MVQEKKMFSFEWLSKYRGLLMGLETILIIIFHYTEDCSIYNVRFDGAIEAFYYWIRSSGVDAFLLFSGLGLYFSWKNNPNYQEFYKKRYIRVLIPYVIVAVITWGLWDLVYKDLGIVQFIKDFTFISFIMDGEKWLWYILMISICYLIFPYIFRVVEDAGDAITEQMRILTLCTMCTVVLVIMKLYHTELYENISIALLRFPAFFLGCLLGKMTYEKRETPVWWVGGLLATSIILVAPLKFGEIPILRIYATTQLNISICLVVILFMERISKSLNKGLQNIYSTIKVVLEWFGKYSLEIYLVHVVVREFMNEMGFELYQIKNELIMIVCSVILAILLKKSSDILVKKID